MKEEERSKNHIDIDNDIDLSELFYVLLRGKWVIVSVTIFASIIGIVYSLFLPNVYESKAVIVPVNTSSSIAGAYASYSSLAGLAGINLPSAESEIGNPKKAIKKVTSLSFFKNNILPNIYLPDLMAVKSWNSKNNKLIYDESIYDTKSDAWIRDFSYPQKQIPSAQESFEEFRDILSLSEDKKSGFIYITIKHQSPYLAKQWVELVINEVNNFYRLKDKLKSEKASIYLNKQISITSLSEVKEALAELLREETKKLSLIEANRLYVFDYIDPPEVMEKKSEPKRSLIFILATFIGGIFGIFIVLIRHFVSHKN